MICWFFSNPCKACWFSRIEAIQVTTSSQPFTTEDTNSRENGHNKIILLYSDKVGEIKTSPHRLRLGMAFGQGLGWSANNLSLHRKRCQTFRQRPLQSRSMVGEQRDRVSTKRDNRIALTKIPCIKKKIFFWRTG